MSKPNLIQKLSSLSSQTLYLLLIVICAGSLLAFPKTELPSKPEEQSTDLYVALSQLTPDKPILVQSDWTNSSRGESAGQFEALLRILMRKNVKFLLYSVGDPQAPQVARGVITNINEERKKAGLPVYELWRDYVDGGYTADPSGAFATSMKSNIRAAFQGKKNKNDKGDQEEIFKSPVLASVKSIKDFQLLVNITASGTMDFLIARVGGSVPLSLMCTGVIGPQMQQYYAAGQLVGLSIGLKGVYDVERMMEYGVRGSGVPSNGPNDKRLVSNNHSDVDIPPFTGQINLDRGSKYNTALHFALALMILAVFAGNLSLIAQRFKRGNA